jgi:hypothetical protein
MAARVSERPASSADERPAPSPGEGQSRRLLIVLVAILVFGWVFLYRFNTLGGAFGGFDNDHFLHFVYAKQVQAGEQPLRDFLDAGLQGAAPSLTYELSAAAQNYFGNNLRSEAWLTVGAIALAAAVTFVAASTIAPWPWALAMALLSALISPKLYSYPKVLVTAVASLLIVGSSGLPTPPRIALMSVCTAVAFLFRHDLAMYCVVGFVVMMGCAPGAPWRGRLTRAAAYLVVTGVMLAPSLWWVQRYRGLPEYLRNGLEMSRNEAERTRIGWPRFSLDAGLSSVFASDDNAETWIYYVFLAVPVIVLGATAWKMLRVGIERASADTRAAALVALSVMTMLLSHYFLRGNLAARFGDMAPPMAVLAAYLLFVSTKGLAIDWPAFAQRTSVGRLATAAVAIAVFATTVACTWRLASVGSELRTARLLEPGDVFTRTRQASRDLAEMPASLRELQAADRMQAAAYLHRCTKPTDRALILGYATDVLAFSERLFAGGRASFFVGFYTDERYSREAVASLESRSVPIVLGGELLDDARMPVLVNYLRSHYDEVGKVTINEDELRVLVRRGLASVPAGPGGLPCFG